MKTILNKSFSPPKQFTCLAVKAAVSSLFSCCQRVTSFINWWSFDSQVSSVFVLAVIADDEARFLNRFFSPICKSVESIFGAIWNPKIRNRQTLTRVSLWQFSTEWNTVALGEEVYYIFLKFILWLPVRFLLNSVVMSRNLINVYLSVRADDVLK